MRAGYQPICLDAFADADLAAVATVQRIEPYPDALVEALEALPRCPLMYVGAIENLSYIIAVAEQFHRVHGNTVEVVEQVRDPRSLAHSLRLIRCALPQWRPANDPPAADGSWVLKPLASAGGRGIAVWDESAATSPTLKEPHVFQQRIEGTPCSAVFLAPDGIGDVRFIGLTEQLLGEPACRADKFMWCGNIGPIAFSVQTESQIRRIGNVLKSQTGLRGLFGIDFVVDKDGVPWVMEVNPRYPASLELLEFATRQALIPQHNGCFTDEEELLVPLSDWQAPQCPSILAKAVLYAKRDFLVAQALPVDLNAPQQFPEYADVPSVGSTIEAGQPICTVYAAATTLEECRILLFENVAKIEAGFYE